MQSHNTAFDRWWQNTQEALPVKFEWRSSSSTALVEEEHYSRTYILAFLGLDAEVLAGLPVCFAAPEELHITVLFIDTHGVRWNEFSSELGAALACTAGVLFEYLQDIEEDFYLWRGPWWPHSWAYQPLYSYSESLAKVRLALQGIALSARLPEWTMGFRDTHIAWQ